MSFSRRHFLASAVRRRRRHRAAVRHALRAGRADQARLGPRQLGQPRRLRQADGAWRPRSPPRRSTPPAGCSAARSRSIQYDTQSDIALYTKYAQQLARDDKVDVVHGGITSASREAIRQTFRRANIAYFYNVLYEGGVCDRNCFVTGTTPAQAVEPIVEIAMKQWGKKVYVLAADYNYGQITAKWLAHYVKQRGGTVLQDRFLPARRRRLRLDDRQDPGRPSPTSSAPRWSAARTCRSSASGRRRA